MAVNGSEYPLAYDQVGTLKAVVSPTGNVVKAIQYDAFGNLLWDSNPGLRTPLGFAGGLSDPDTGFVRFGWRDYDPDTGRWTAQDPIGDAGGDDDWYGYCLDDPVNAIDPKGLAGFLLPFLAGQGIATGIGTVGSLLSGLMADGAGSVAGKNEDDPLKATKGTAKAAAGAAAFNAGISFGATGAAGATEAASAIGASAPTLIRQGKDAFARVSDKILPHGQKIEKGAKILNDTFNDSLPPETVEGQALNVIKNFGSEAIDQLQKKQRRIKRIQALLLSGGGVSCFLMGLLIYFDSFHCWRGYCWEWEGTNMFVGPAIMVLSIPIVVYALSSLKEGPTSTLICTNCESVFPAEEVQTTTCPACGNELESINDFYERHPELKKND